MLMFSTDTQIGLPETWPAIERRNLARCVCSEPWSAVVGRTCPVHGFFDVMRVTC